MRYRAFHISNFKAIKNAEIDLTRDQLILLLGVNESGKTSLLKAVAAFDYSNDPKNAKETFASIRNKRELNSSARVSSKIMLENGDVEAMATIVEGITGSDEASSVQIDLKRDDEITVTRTFNFTNAVFVDEKYSLDPESLAKISPQLNDDQVDKLARDMLSKCPLIIYFEDFKDHIPDFISTSEESQYYNEDWVSTLEGLFYHADQSLSVEQFESIAEPNARNSALNRVNNALNKQFTSRWNRKLKGTKTIDRVELLYNSESKLFKFTAVGKDKETVFDIDERSKGASWYLTFLLKTEFRKKHLNVEHGQTVYLIDEPGSNLHSTAQSNMVNDFRTLSTDSIVLYTTHSQHLIDKANLSNVYIVKFAGKSVEAQRFQEYVIGKKINTTFYQPIIDALEIQPFSLDFNWKKAVIVEGISDYAALRLMFEHVLGEELDFVVMPGTSATNLDTLISLHIGWGAKLMTLLDYDDTGREQQARYQDAFPSIASCINTLNDPLPTGGKDLKLEGLFSEADKLALLKSARMTPSGPTVKKKELQNALYIVGNDPSAAANFKRQASAGLKKNFEQILAHIRKNLQ